MRCEKQLWTSAVGWGERTPCLQDAGMVLYFGERDALASGERHRELQAAYPQAHLLGCSTGGQIAGGDLLDEGVAAVAVRFERTRLRLASVDVVGSGGSHAAGEALGHALKEDDLAGVFLLSDGLHVNGSRLVAGLAATLGPAVPLSGGLAGDGPHFRATLVGAGDEPPRQKRVAAIGFYGRALRVGHGTGGGWERFGPSRLVTRSEGNLLFELDGVSALGLYERYLGDEAEGLPGTGLHYPLRVWDADKPQHDAVRTVLAVDKDARTMTFAGDIPQGSYAQLMHGHFGQLVSGATEAAHQALHGAPLAAGGAEHLAILISCIGRRLAMGQAITDELAAATAALPPGSMTTGFYSYGEIAPHAHSGICELHNQSMTITVLSEAVG